MDGQVVGVKGDEGSDDAASHKHHGPEDRGVAGGPGGVLANYLASDAENRRLSRRRAVHWAAWPNRRALRDDQRFVLVLGRHPQKLELREKSEGYRDNLENRIPE